MKFNPTKIVFLSILHISISISIVISIFILLWVYDAYFEHDTSCYSTSKVSAMREMEIRLAVELAHHHDTTYKGISRDDLYVSDVKVEPGKRGKNDFRAVINYNNRKTGEPVINATLFENCGVELWI